MRSRRSRGRLSGIDIDPAALRQARRQAGLTLAQVAGIELTRQAVHLIETGKMRPSARSLRIIANRLGVSESEFVVLLDTGQPEPSELGLGELEDLCRRHDYAEVVKRAGKVLQRSGPPRSLALAHMHTGQALYYLFQPDEALEQLRQARELLESAYDPRLVAECMDWEAITLHLKEDARALSVGREALRRYQALQPRSPETEARILEHIGTILAGRRDFDLARAHYETALQVAGGVRDLSRLARIYHGLAGCWHGLGDLRPASELLFKAVTLYEAERRISPTPLRTDLPRAENDLGLLTMERGDLDRADELLRSSLDHFVEAGAERVRSHVLLSLGELRRRQGRLEEAFVFVEQAMELAARFGETMALASGHRQLGELQAARDRYDLAEASFRRAVDLLEAAGLEERRADCLEAYERVLAERGRTGTGSRSIGA